MERSRKKRNRRNKRKQAGVLPLILIPILVLAIGALITGGCRQPTQSQPAIESSPAAAQPKPAYEIRTGIGFASRKKFLDHYEKHGREFGAISLEEYLRRAQELRDRPAGGDVLEIARADGVISRFDRASGAFLAFDRDLTIRTFFKPNDGEAYFRRQAKRNR